MKRFPEAPKHRRPDHNPKAGSKRLPVSCGGDACIRNTRIAVWMLVEGRRIGMSDEQLLQAHPALSQANLEAAWDYYRRQCAEIDQPIDENAVA
jgi:uncharacterized protein (DUF433 family)